MSAYAQTGGAVVGGGAVVLVALSRPRHMRPNLERSYQRYWSGCAAAGNESNNGALLALLWVFTGYSVASTASSRRYSWARSAISTGSSLSKSTEPGR